MPAKKILDPENLGEYDKITKHNSYNYYYNL